MYAVEVLTEHLCWAEVQRGSGHFLQEVIVSVRGEKQAPVIFKRMFKRPYENLYETVIITDYVRFDKVYEKIVCCCLADGHFE
ncbi:MAG: hypothetical protein D3925_14330 [Candidatus Electrothrix sp. AR5]|nr:hypothetical protein [Candidatus Electrothrix sp. AR5]